MGRTMGSLIGWLIDVYICWNSCDHKCKTITLVRNTKYPQLELTGMWPYIRQSCTQEQIQIKIIYFTNISPYSNGETHSSRDDPSMLPSKDSSRDKPSTLTYCRITFRWIQNWTVWAAIWQTITELFMPHKVQMEEWPEISKSSYQQHSL